jgi:hypothetical protein
LHEVIRVAAGIIEYLPSWQGMHTLSDVAAISELYFPEEQKLQKLDPASELKYPPGQSVHGVPKPPSEYDPLKQLLQLPATSVLPAWHPSQVVEPAAAVEPGQFRHPSLLPAFADGRYFPTAQGTQDGLVSPSLLVCPSPQLLHASCSF